MVITWRQALRLHVLFWLAIPLLIGWALRDIPVRAIWETLLGLRFSSLLVLAGLNFAILILFSARWWLILRAQGYRRSYLALVGYRLAAFGVTYFTPGPQLGGEPLQVYLLQRRQAVPAASAAASVTLDKLLELLANFTFLLVGVSTIVAAGIIQGPLRLQAFSAALLLLALPLLYLLFLGQGRHPLTRLLGRFTRRLHSPGIERFRQFVAAAEIQVGQLCKAQSGAILLALLVSFIVWAAVILEVSLALRFLGFDLNLSQAIIILTAARIAYLLPIPAGLGTLEAGQVFAMQSLGLDPALGLSLSFLIRARDLALSGLGLWLGGFLSR
jgi:uncharacterized protein (TIRG00374 family)